MYIIPECSGNRSHVQFGFGVAQAFVCEPGTNWARIVVFGGGGGCSSNCKTRRVNEISNMKQFAFLIISHDFHDAQRDEGNPHQDDDHRECR